MRLRTYFLLLGCVGLLPVLVACVTAIVINTRSEQMELEQGLFRTARAAAATVDRRLGETIGTLNAVALSNTMANGDIAQVYSEIQRISASQAQWKSVTLVSGAGTEIIFNTLFPLGVKFGAPTFGGYKKVIETREPAVSPVLFESVITGDRVVIAAGASLQP